MSGSRTDHRHGRARLLGGGLQVLAGEGLALPVGVVVAAMLARATGADGYGVFALAASIAGTIEWGFTSLFSRASIKLVGDADDWQPIAAALLRLHTHVGLAAGALLAIAAWPLGAFFDEPRVGVCLAILAVGVPISTVAMACRNILVGRGDYRARALTGATRWTARLLAIGTFVALGWSVVGAVLGEVVATAAALGVARTCVGRLTPAVPTALWRRFWELALPTFVLAMSLRLLDKVGLVALKVLGGSIQDLGLYAAAQNFSIAPGLVAIAFTPLLLSSTSRALVSGDLATARAMGGDALRLTILTWPLAAIVAGSSHEVVRLVYGQRFDAAAPLAAPFIISAFAVAIISIVSALLTALGKVQVASRAAWPLLPVAIVGYVVVVPRFGAIGAAVVTGAAALVGAALSLRALWLVWQISLPMATCIRSLVVSVAVCGAAIVWPAPGAWWLVKALALSTATLAAFVVLGEFSAEGSSSPGARYWDDVAGEWGGGRDRLWRRHSDSVNAALCRRWLPERVHRLLKTDAFDEASSDGLWLMLRSRADVVEGIDQSPAIAAQARARHPEMAITVADVRALPFPDRHFDAVLSNSTLDHFEHHAGIEQSLRELHRVLEPGGQLILTLDNPANPVVALRNALPFALLNRVGLVPYFVGATLAPRALTDLLRQVGFDVVETTAIVHCPRVLAVPAARAVEGLSSRPETHARFLRALSWFEVAERWPSRFRTGHFVAVLARRRA
ncbi:MAG: methyltransferase domain-containing protein [Vicinamibacterales bacterium]